MKAYDAAYHLELQEGIRSSAQEIVPLILDLVHPRKVADIGCGLGTWLAVFKEHAIEDFLGVDGDFLDLEHLEIPPEQFLAWDLRRPLHLGQQFDLVMCLEVAEHLPEEFSDTLVASLAALGGVILFSAAVPFQGGTNHLNEQWPDYWVERFAKHGYLVIDCIRERIWQNPYVQWWYAQNMLIFARQECIQSNPALIEARERTHLSQLSLVHPRKYLELCHWWPSELATP